jgi:acetyl esterase/lipase
MTTTRRPFIVFAALMAGMCLITAEARQSAVEMKTLPYATRAGQELLLDLYLPKDAARPLPVIVFLHGGGWSGGTRTTGPDFRRFFAQDGFAMASIDYRLTPSVTFPSNVEDVKTAIRWLRANAATHGLNADRICLWGTSAGGHLAAVAALAPRGTFEGVDNLDRSSDVRCVLDAYGPTDFAQMDAQTEREKATLQPQHQALLAAPPMRGGVVVDGASRGEGAGRGSEVVGGNYAPANRGAGRGGPTPHDAPSSPESRLIGAPVQTAPDRVRAASPLTYVSGGTPPFLIMHGLADNSVPHGQSVLLYEALAQAGADAILRLIDGLPHTFFNRTNLDELAGPFRMDVREHPRGGAERRLTDRAGVFDVARDFFRKHLR